MKNRIQTTTPRLVGSGLLAVALFMTVGLKTFAAAPPTDPAHAAHVAAGAMPSSAAKGDSVLAQQVSELQAKVAQLEATLAQHPAPMASSGAATMPGMPAAASPPMSMGMGKMKSGGAMANMTPAAPPAPPMAGMSGAAAPAGGMMGMMSQMMGMMDKMMAMDDDKMEMAGMGGGAMPSAPAAPMSGGMGDDKMEMAGMMGMMDKMMPMGSGSMPQSTLPGFPGASHLYHIGATGFFLDHPQHIALTTQQQAGLSKAKEQALLAKNTSDRGIEQAEQELWTLTAADQPDATAIQAKITAIGKLTGDQRLAFIRAVGDASKILTDEQRKSLTGFAPPASAAPAAAPMAPMKDM